MKTKHQGFTLLEVMVALAILAVVAVAASQASRSYIQSVGNMKTRTQAYFVAQNALADLRIQGVWLTGEQSKQVDENDKQWQVTITPTAVDTGGLKFDTLQKLSVAVAPINDGVALHPLVNLDAVLAKPSQPVPANGGTQ